MACFHIFGSPNVNVLLKETNFHPLQQRKSDGEHESSRRLKTQFLIEMEGFDSGSEQILLIGKRNWNMHVWVLWVCESTLWWLFMFGQEQQIDPKSSMKQQEDGLPRDSTFLFLHLVKNNKRFFHIILWFCSEKLPLRGLFLLLKKQEHGLYRISYRKMGYLHYPRMIWVSFAS